MDDIVLQAMAKWPAVPHCYGWLALDARGDYYMRDDACQAAGAFQTYRSNARDALRIKGSRINHDKLLAFIHRNYLSDERGAWYFQNGPQRVYVELELAPYVWRIEPNGAVLSHTGERVTVIDMQLSDEGALVLHTSLGFGTVHPQDMLRASELLSGVNLLADKPAVNVNMMAKQQGWLLSPQQVQHRNTNA